MTEDRLITLAIHTYEKAVMLKSLLENEGIEVVLHNVNLIQPVVSSGVRVRIHESDLALALRIVENVDLFLSHDKRSNKHSHPEILFPLDFSDHSIRACDFAFYLAKKHNASVVLLNTYINPFHPTGFQLTESKSYDFIDNEERQRLENDATEKMERFCKQLKNRIKIGELPPIRFSYEIREGVPEEVITEYAKEINPLTIVMGTRSFDKKEKELIGSVSAEVLDSCHYPVITIPETKTISKTSDIKHIMFYAGLEQEDILSLDYLYRHFTNETFEITIVGIPQKKRGTEIPIALEKLTEYCKVNYPNYSFTPLPFDNAVRVIDKLHENVEVDLVVMPNKKKNIFSRLFNPSLAHKLLFNTDIPILAIPI